jgi:hypothetical protein
MEDHREASTSSSHLMCLTADINLDHGAVDDGTMNSKGRGRADKAAEPASNARTTVPAARQPGSETQDLEPANTAQKNMQELAAQALGLSPREGSPSAPADAGAVKDARNISADQHPTEAAAQRRISSIQDILGSNVSPVKTRANAEVAQLGSRSLSPALHPPKPALAPRPGSAQPPTISGSTRPSSAGRGAEGLASKSIDAEAHGGLSVSQRLAREAMAAAAGDAKSGSESPHNSITAAAVHVAEPGRWKAVRQTPPVAPAPDPARASVKADPDRAVQDFDVFSYQGEGRRWRREDRGPYLKLAVQADRGVAVASTDEIDVTVDPRRVARMTTLASEGKGGPTCVEMTLASGGTTRVIFEQRDGETGKVGSKVQARRFSTWVMSVNPGVEFVQSG